jgi:GGDEF domain-containing protein
MSATNHDRRYLQDRIGEEIDRHSRHGHPFALFVFEAQTVADGVSVRHRINEAIEAIRPQLRPSDVIARVFEDALAVMLVETDAEGAKHALLRLRGRLATLGSLAWRIETYNYPHDSETIATLPLSTAA